MELHRPDGKRRVLQRHGDPVPAPGNHLKFVRSSIPCDIERMVTANYIIFVLDVIPLVRFVHQRRPGKYRQGLAVAARMVPAPSWTTEYGML